MRTLNYSPFGITERLSEQEPLTICLEYPPHFRRFVKDLNDCRNGLSEPFTFLDEDGKKNLALSKLQIISDPTAIDFNSKRVLNALTKEVIQICKTEETISAEAAQMLVSFTSKIADKLPYLSLDSDIDFNISGIIKLCGFHFESGVLNESIEITEWLQISGQLLYDEIIVLINSGSFYTRDELEEIAAVARQNKLYLILIESAEPATWISCRMLIVDSDLCLIEHRL